MLLARRLVSEAVGTGLLLTAIVGSGTMADRLAGGDFAIELFCRQRGGLTIAQGGEESPSLTAVSPIVIALVSRWQNHHLMVANPPYNGGNATTKLEVPAHV